MFVIIFKHLYLARNYFPNYLKNFFEISLHFFYCVRVSGDDDFGGECIIHLVMHHIENLSLNIFRDFLLGESSLRESIVYVRISAPQQHY